VRRTPRMTVPQFNRKHPNSSFRVLKGDSQKGYGPRLIAYTGPMVGNVVFGHGRNEQEALADASNRLYRLNAREVMEEQGGADANTGLRGPLQAHHIVHRAHGSHDKENLVGLSQASHDRQPGHARSTTRRIAHE
jgi:hypothetical protein